MSTIARLSSSLALLLGMAGCQYDLDKIYQYSVGDGGQDGAVAPRSTHLIGLWSTYAPVDDECLACAEERCADVNEACKGDADCLAYTQCVAETPTPAGQVACRDYYDAWVSAGDVRQRDLNGPYGQCVFRDRCLAECGGAADLSCSQQYAWPQTSAQTVPLKLFLIDALDTSIMVKGVTVKVCPVDGAPDPRCPSPAATGVTDERGSVELNLPTGFSRGFTGFLELTGGNLYPTLLKFSWVVGSETTQVTSVISKSTLQLSTTVLGVTPDPTRGMFQLRMLGCNGIGVRDVRFNVNNADTRTKYWYIVEGTPRLDGTATNDLGAGGIIDAPEGYPTVVTATRVTDGVEVARATAPVRAGYMTIVVFAPLAR